MKINTCQEVSHTLPEQLLSFVLFLDILKDKFKERNRLISILLLFSELLAVDFLDKVHCYLLWKSLWACVKGEVVLT